MEGGSKKKADNGIESYAVMQLCGYAVMQLCGYAVMRLCSYAVMRLCGYAVMPLRLSFELNHLMVVFK